MKTTKSISGVLKITLGLTGRICTSSLVPLLSLLWILSAFGAQATVVLTTLCSFTGINDAGASAALVQGSDGNFYGTTAYGGTTNYNTYGYGTVFRVSTNGALASLYAFGSITNASGEPLDGSGPQAALVQGSDGNFYGTTYGGGAYTNQYVQYGFGTVFKVSTNGALTTLYSFGRVQDTNGVPLDGAYPQAGLVQGSDGNFYGTTAAGGKYTNWGTVFKISTNGALNTLYSFTGGNDGSDPYAGLIRGSDGNFYGTTYGGGAYTNQYGQGNGTVFKISTNGALTTLCSFGRVQDTNGVPLDGSGPGAALVQGRDGNFYGTTVGGGADNSGTVFKISPNGMLTSLYSFFNFRGILPSGLVQGSDGNFYGTTYCDGITGHLEPFGYGSVFRVSTNGALATVYAFGSITNASGEPLDGSGPGALVQGSDGNFYGTTSGGGYLYGTVFRLTIVPPQLSIIPSGPYAILTWPTDYAGFTLQSTTNLGSSAVWTPVSPKPITFGSQNLVISTISGRQEFFRLIQ